MNEGQKLDPLLGRNGLGKPDPPPLEPITNPGVS